MKSGRKFFIPLIAAFVVFQACSKDDNKPANTVHQVSANLNAAQEVPAGTSTGTGTLTGTFDASTNTLNYNVSWNGLSGAATAGHIHGSSTVTLTTNAGVLIPFTLSNSATVGSGTASGSVVLVDSVVNFLQTGKLYANIHTAAKPGGEIRGQLSYQ